METAIVVLLLIIGAVAGSVATYAFLSDKPLREEFEALPEDPQHIARKAQA